ncbi:MAG: hypothetical protein QOD92_446 [Acidimicrobiaceae bacterium]
MKVIDNLTALRALTGEPTIVPEEVVLLCMDGDPQPAWDRVVHRIASGHVGSYATAERLLGDSIQRGEVSALLNADLHWVIELPPISARRVLVRYAALSLWHADTDLDHGDYDAEDAWMVVPLIPEVRSIVAGDDPPPDPELYEEILWSQA